MVLRQIGRWVGAIIGLIVAAVILLILFVHSGLYDLAATYPDSAPVKWIMSTTMDNSVKRHARGIKVPALDDAAMIQAGAHHYRDDCQMCHGAPGVRIGEVGLGLNPKPPELTEAAGDWKPNELFWLTKYGVRMTGMPGWGVIDSDDELWETVAFARKLPTMTPAEYQALTKQAPPKSNAK